MKSTTWVLELSATGAAAKVTLHGNAEPLRAKVKGTISRGIKVREIHIKEKVKENIAKEISKEKEKAIMGKAIGRARVREVRVTGIKGARRDTLGNLYAIHVGAKGIRPTVVGRAWRKLNWKRRSRK